MSIFAKYYQTEKVCYDSDYDENDYQPPDEDDEPDTLDESVPSNCLFTKQVPVYENAKKPTKKMPKDGRSDICGYYGTNPKICKCYSCSLYYRGELQKSCSSFCGGFFKDDWLATKLDVGFTDKEFVKSQGARWSQSEKTWYVILSNPNYHKLVKMY